ncbi:MAG: DUF3427 domain-containing protein [Allobaculum sp.]
MSLNNGIYEQVINNEITDELKAIPERCQTSADIDKAEASRILASYLTGVVQKGLEAVLESRGQSKGDAKDKSKHGNDDETLAAAIDLTNRIVDIIQNETHDPYFSSYQVADPGKQLLEIVDQNDPYFFTHEQKKKTETVKPRPATSLAQSSLFTGAPFEPSMYDELKKEIASADRIDFLVSFIKWNGLRLLKPELKKFTERGGELRVITTTYISATDLKAIQELSQLANTKIKINYNTRNTRLHAKAYIFYRDTGFTTAYVGSSNLSKSAVTTGLEWNIKVTEQDLPDLLNKINASFEMYWNDEEFEYYEESQQERLARALKAEKFIRNNDINHYVMDIVPYSYQQEILDRLEAERELHHFTRNLIVAATGTGKTVLAAFDYRNFCKKHKGQKNSLLFVAHREEILKQSLATFRAVLKDENFGDLFVGGYKPENDPNHLFISIQTFNSQKFTTKNQPDTFDYIVVDESHHSSAASYKELLEYFQPKILLGLTATPERMDNKSILPYFNNRIAAEIRLPEAIERQLLCPFQYFGITDEADLSSITWRGGYDKTELTNLYTSNSQRTQNIIKSLFDYVTDIDNVKGLGFCVSVKHAEYMAEAFNQAGIPSIYLTGYSSDEDRKWAKRRLINGEICFIFVVDLYNEGVDIPEVNTILFLRPTESLTIFLQQLGRGLRLAENKDCLTVLDYIGQANKKYRFLEKFESLRGNHSSDITREIKSGSLSAPRGCFIQLEKKASEVILKNIRDSIRNQKELLISQMLQFRDDHPQELLSLRNFIEHYHLDPRVLYKTKDLSFSRLCVQAGIMDNFKEPLEKEMVKAYRKFAFADSWHWLGFLMKILPHIGEIHPDELSPLQKRMLKMFYITLWGNESTANLNDAKVLDHFRQLANSPVLLSELEQLVEAQLDRIDFLDKKADLGFECPLDVHCTYSRDQILVALDYDKPSNMREGVTWLKDKKIDVFFVTLNKSDKDYSPTTLYEDYSINDRYFHWQSQSTVSPESKTGQRYIHHKKLGSKIMLFVRDYKKDRFYGSDAPASPYTYLGTANYVRHEGSRPMSITLKLDEPIPAKYLKKTNKLRPN